MRPRRPLALVAALVAVTAAAPANAQLTVFDPANHVENALQAARSLEQLANQARQLANQARMLARSPLSQSGEIGRALAAIDSLSREVEGLSADARSLERQFEALYGKGGGPQDKLKLLQQSLARLDAARDTARDLARLSAELNDRAAGQRQRIGAALAASEGSEGQTAAIQSSTQLLGVLSEQLGGYQALAAAQARLQASEAARNAADREAAAEAHRRLWARESSVPAAPAFDPLARARR